MRTTATPPIVKNAPTPSQVLGDLYNPFCMWIQQCAGSQTPPKLKDDDAARMGQCLDRLAEAGYVVGHHNTGQKLNARGQVIFSQRMMSATDVMRDSIPLDSPAEARRLFKKKMAEIG